MTDVAPFDGLSCDTSVALGTATFDGSVIFAKNSDRAANECQPLRHVPREEHGFDRMVRCQYIEIPQVATTYEVIGSQPYWLWGFEMGVNEWGVTIGNEAVLSRAPYEDVALIGMDLVRLGLERGRTADEAVAVIGELVERYGQGGSCEASYFRTYHNSFIVADPNGAWVVETAGHQWFGRRVRDRAAISNLFTIERDWDASSPGAVDYAREQGWATEPFSVASTYQDPAADLSTRVCRLDRARAVLGAATSPITVEGMQALLRDHDSEDLPVDAQPLPTICMHTASDRTGETAGSLVAQLRPGRPPELAVTAWAAFGSPCLSVFRPVYPCGVGLPENLDRGGERFDADSPWWAFERLQRIIAQAPSLASVARERLGALEAAFRSEAAIAEAEADRLFAIGYRPAALATLRALVDDTSVRVVELARHLASELAERAANVAAPAMVRTWQPFNDAVGLRGVGAFSVAPS